MSPEPFLLLDEALVASAGSAPHAPLSLAVTGPRAVLIGDAEPVLGPLFRRASLLEGSFSVLGRPIDQVDPALVGLAPLEPLLPPSLSPVAYVSWSARLAGIHASDAPHLAQQLCLRLGLGAWASRPMAGLHAVHRRVAVLAHAMATNPALLVVEAPLAGLDPEAAAFMLQALGVASEGRLLLASSPPPEPGSPDARLVDGADERFSLDPR